MRHTGVKLSLPRVRYLNRNKENSYGLENTVYLVTTIFYTRMTAIFKRIKINSTFSQNVSETFKIMHNLFT